MLVFNPVKYNFYYVYYNIGNVEKKERNVLANKFQQAKLKMFVSVFRFFYAKSRPPALVSFWKEIDFVFALKKGEILLLSFNTVI